MGSNARLGLITTGQGPRDEYVSYHRNLLRQLGADVETTIVHALDGLSRAEIREIEARPGDTYIGCHIHEQDATGDRMGPGWGHVWVASHHLVPLYQKWLDQLEAQGVDATILCCVEEYSSDDFRSQQYLVLPWLAITEWVRVTTISKPEPKIGILIPDDEHLEQDTATWQSQPWMSRLCVFIEPKKGRLRQALTRFRQERVDMVINWGYGFGLAPEDPPDLIRSIEETVGAPFVTPQRLATLYVRSLFRSSIDERRFAGTDERDSGEETS